jgi:ATP-dependent DNA ligase
LSHAHEDALGNWVKNKDYVDKFPPLFITENLIQAFKELRNIDVVEVFTNVIRVEEGKEFECMGKKLILHEVEHADNTPTYAVEINDEILHSEDIYAFKDNSILDNKKLWIADGSLFDRDIMTHHMSMKKAIALASEHNVEMLIFTQIGYNGGMTHQQLHDICHKYANENYPKLRHISLAFEGKTETIKADILKLGFIDPAKPKYRIFEFDELKALKQFTLPMLFQKKYDGFQAQLHTQPDAHIYSGRGERKDGQFKSIIKDQLSKLPENSIFDAESLMYEGSQPLHRSMIIGYADSTNYDVSQESKCIFEIYDVLYWKGEDVRKKPLEERLKILTDIKEQPNIKVMGGTDNRVVSSYSQMESAKKHCYALKGSEGAMIKVLDAPYESPQNSTWAKIKKTYEVDCLVVEKKESKPGTYNYYVAAGPLPDKCVDVYRKFAGDDLREVSGEAYAYLGGTFNTSIRASVGDIIRIDTIEVNKREIKQTGCFTYGLFHPRVLENISDIKSVPDQLSILDHIASFALPLAKASKETLDGEYDLIAEAGTRLPNRFYKFNTSKTLKFVLHEHKPGVKAPPSEAEEPKVPAHGERGFKSLEKDIHLGVTESVIPSLILKFRDHLDLRMEIREDNVIWHGYTPHPPQEPTVWDVFKQRLADHRQVQCAAKSPCTNPKCMEWFKIGKDKWDELPAGEPGASTVRTGLVKIVDSGTYELGTQRENMHEYFFKGNTIKGKVVCRRLTMSGETNWFFTLPEDQMPLKPWEHEDSGEWRIIGAEAPQLEKAFGKPFHVDTGLVPEGMIRKLSDDLTSLYEKFKLHRETKREVLAEADIIFQEYSDRIAESAKLRLTKQLKRKVNLLPSDLQSRLNRMTSAYHEDFKMILDDWEAKH